MNYQDIYAVLTPQQMKLSRATGLQRLNTEGSEQQYLFLKLNRDHAERVAHDWTAKQHGAAYVLRLSVSENYLQSCERMSVAYAEHEEYKIAVADLATLHWHMQHAMSVVTVYWDPKPNAQREIVSFA